MAKLPLPEPGRQAAVAFVSDHLRSVTDGEVEGSSAFEGGMVAAKRALTNFDVTEFASRMHEVTPQPKRAASGLSPYLRHGLLTQREVWNHVEGGPEADVSKFREQLLWQEYARHWYSRLGPTSKVGTSRELSSSATRSSMAQHSPAHQAVSREQLEAATNPGMACLDMSREELEEDGWIVGRSRSWLASYLAANGYPWRTGEDYFFRHLLDGSRGANRLGWQTAAGLTGSKPFLFNRWQVEKWAAGLCASCDLVRECPVESPVSMTDYVDVAIPIEARVGADLLRSAGPPTVERVGQPDAVWLTAESLGSTDPALFRNAALPVVFVFDQPLLARLRISPKRLVFLVETLAELGRARDLTIWFGDPRRILTNYQVAVTYAPVPGFGRRLAKIGAAELHPWPWLIEPTTGDVTTYRDWRRSVGALLPRASTVIPEPTSSA